MNQEQRLAAQTTEGVSPKERDTAAHTPSVGVAFTLKPDPFSGLYTILDGHNVVAQDVGKEYAERIVDAVNEGDWYKSDETSIPIDPSLSDKVTRATGSDE